jgi:adenosylcobinamide-phosphate guanylyltransferase
MAGGRSTRMGSNLEKPLAEIGGKAMILLVLEALMGSKNIERVVVAVSPHTPKTRLKVKEIGLEVIETPGAGYEDDMKFAIKHLKLLDVMVVSADLPFMTSSIVDRAIEAYKSRGKPALSVMATVSLVEKQGTKPSYVFEVHGKRLVPIGINIIDGTKIDEPELEETVLIAEPGDSTLNVNTMQELSLARETKLRGQSAHGKER